MQFSEPLVTKIILCLECTQIHRSVSPVITGQVRFLGEWTQFRTTDHTLPSLVCSSVPYALQVKTINPSSKQPVQATDGATGYDLYTPIAVVLGPYSEKLIPLGLAISVPQGLYERVADRSSLAKMGLHILSGVIDSDYRGELKANLSDRRHLLAQLILAPLHPGYPGGA